MRSPRITFLVCFCFAIFFGSLNLTAPYHYTHTQHLKMSTPNDVVGIARTWSNIQQTGQKLTDRINKRLKSSPPDPHLITSKQFVFDVKDRDVIHVISEDGASRLYILRDKIPASMIDVLFAEEDLPWRDWLFGEWDDEKREFVGGVPCEEYDSYKTVVKTTGVTFTLHDWE